LNLLRLLGFIAAFLLLIPAAARADDSGPAPYATFVTGAQVQNGLFNIIRKGGKVYMEIAPSQLDQDFIQSAEQVNALGGWFVIPGGISSVDYIVRFSRNDDKIVITWPNEYFIAPGNDSAQRAIKRTFANSVVAVAPIVATDAANGHLVFDASFLLGDVYNLAAVLKRVTGPDPEQMYRLDPDRTLFGPTKAFPDNVIITANQTWACDNPQTIDNVPDPRTLSLQIAYNFVQPPNDGDYMPRLADTRVGYFDTAFLNFATDTNYSRINHYVTRWNMQPSDPTKPLSQALHPMVFYLSDNIPAQYRDPIRKGILAWNQPFEKIGISDAVQVKDQPDDPNWDPDDVRYNTVLWLTESNGGGFAAENQIVDPRTGQEIRTNIVVDADVMTFSNLTWQFLTQPTVGAASDLLQADDREYALYKREQGTFGRIALAAMGHPLSGSALATYNDQLLQSFVVHEAGHAMGFQHNFISTMAYTAKELQSKAFTAKYGVATSVMAYAPLNLWPKGYNQGMYWQLGPGPYDFHTIHWGYARIPGAKTPRDEVPTLDRWASEWTNPLYRFASDEDVDFGGAHAIDPRISQFTLTNNPLEWGATQLQLCHDLLSSIDRHWPELGNSYDQERAAFSTIFFTYLVAATFPEHYIGGEYLSRSYPGDPKAQPPLVQVPRSEELQAFRTLDKYVFSDGAWSFSPATLNRLVYSEWETAVPAAWAYDPTPRHDIPVAEMAEQVAQQELTTMFQPLMLERLDDLPLKAKAGTTMSLTDLFDWTQASIFGDLRDPKLNSIGEVHRATQQWYARKLTQLWLAPSTDTPFDAQSMARAELVDLRARLATALSRSSLDEMTRAHLESLQDVVTRALQARQTVPSM
jgi:Met-zincin/Domain of unknown function (DUF5117)/Domain of unknown function (DUF5118)